MKSNKRQLYLKIAAIAIFGMLIFDSLILTPLMNRWKSGNERIEVLTKQIKRGRGLIDREKSIRDRWSDMMRKDLSDNDSEAEGYMVNAVQRWMRDSRVISTSLTPKWQSNKEQGFQTLEVRVSLLGDQASLCRFLYELEKDSLSVRLEDCEMTPKDDRGRQLSLNARITAVRLNTATRSPR